MRSRLGDSKIVAHMIGVAHHKIMRFQLYYRKIFIISAIAVGCFLLASPVLARDLNRPIPIKPENTRPPEVKIWSASFQKTFSFSALNDAPYGGNIAVGDVDGDGRPEIIVGSGPRHASEVRLFSAGGIFKNSFLIYDKNFQGGVRVGVGDVDGDGVAEIITVPGPGVSSIVHILNSEGKEKLSPGIHLAYEAKFIGGAHVAVDDLDDDGKAEIIISPGPGGGPHIKIFDAKMKLVDEFFSFDQNMTDGVTISTIKTPQGKQLVTAPESWSAPVVRRFSFKPTKPVAEFLAFAPDDKYGVTTAAFDMDNDGFDEVAAIGNGGRSSELRVFDIYGTKIGAWLVQDPNYRGAVSLAQINQDGKGAPELAIIPAAPIIFGPTDKDKFVEVNITEQRLYAYEHGRIAKTFLVSTGTYKFPTPIAKTSVNKKIPLMDYRWSYGPRNPNNYNIKNVAYNLNILPHIYIHSAYWHNNFGHRMSHGCINTALKDAEWIYNWADLGTEVETRN